MNSGGYQKLSEVFFAQNYPDLQVTARRRKQQNVTINTAASAVSAFFVQIAMDPTDKLAPGDGLLFDYVAVGWGGNGAPPNATLQGAVFAVGDSVGHSAPVGQVLGTLPAAPFNTSNTEGLMVFDTGPKLWTVPDLLFMGIGGTAGAVDINSQPWFMQVFAAVLNPSAVALNLFVHLHAMYRIVRGLQEG